MTQEIKSISLDGSELIWDDIDRRACSIGFDNRSQYIRYLCERDIFMGRLSKHKELLLYLTILLGFSIIIVLIILGV